MPGTVTGVVRCSAHSSHLPPANQSYQVALFDYPAGTTRLTDWINLQQNGMFTFGTVADRSYILKIKLVGGAGRRVVTPPYFTVEGGSVFVQATTDLWSTDSDEGHEATWYYLANVAELNENEDGAMVVWGMLASLPKGRFEWLYFPGALSSYPNAAFACTLQDVVLGVAEEERLPQPDRHDIRLDWRPCVVFR